MSKRMIVLHSLTVICIAASAAAAASPPARASTVAVTDFHSHRIYHSPQSPGYSAWCTLWGRKGRDADGALRLAFQQVTGPVDDPAKRVNVTIVMGSDDEAKTWKKLREVPARKDAPVPTDGYY